MRSRFAAVASCATFLARPPFRQNFPFPLFRTSTQTKRSICSALPATSGAQSERQAADNGVKDTGISPPTREKPNVFIDHGAVRMQSLVLNGPNGKETAQASDKGGDKSASKKRHLRGFAREPPILVLHGLFGSGSNWRGVARSLQERLRVAEKSDTEETFLSDNSMDREMHLIDLRNHGMSPATEPGTHTFPLMALDILQYMHDRNIPRATLVGHSMGGRLAMLLALNYPDLFDSLVVVDVAPVTYPPSVVFSDFITEMAKLTPEQRASRKAADIALSNAIPDAQVRQFLMTNLVRSSDKNKNGMLEWRLPFDTIEAGLAHLRRFVVRADRRFTGPTLFVGGTASEYILPEYHEISKALFPRAEIEMIEGAGHWVHFERTEEFVDIVASFMERYRQAPP